MKSGLAFEIVADDVASWLDGGADEAAQLMGGGGRQNGEPRMAGDEAARLDALARPGRSLLDVSLPFIPSAAETLEFALKRGP